MRYAMIAFALLAAGAVRAQAPDPNEPPITLVVTPTDIPTNGRVTLSGLAVPVANAQVSITVTGPGAPPQVLVAAPDKSGHYSIKFGDTQAEGTYRVSAQLGAQGAAAKTSFTTRTSLLDVDGDVADNKDLLAEDSTLVAALKKAVDNVPESPVKEDMGKKLDALKDVSDQGPAQSVQLAKALQNFKQLVSTHPETLPYIQPIFDHLSELGEDAKKTREQVKAEVEGSQKQGSNCDQIDHMTQSLKAVPEAFEAALESYDFVLGFVTTMASQAAPEGYRQAVSAAGDAASLAHSLREAREGEDAAKAWEEGQTAEKTTLAKTEIETGLETKYGEKLASSIPASLKENPAFKIVVSEIKKFAPQIIAGDKEPTKIFELGAKLAGDALAYGSDQVFSKYCQKFEGEFTATMTAHFYAKSNRLDSLPVEWWSYSTTIKGKMTLRYPKAAEGNAVQLTGQFEGGATKFSYKEDVFHSTLFGRMTKGGVVHVVDVPPVATDNGEGGLINSNVSPTSFYVPLTGQLVGNTITVALQPARSDFSDSYTKAHTVYVVQAPTTLFLPIWGHFALPYSNAHFILDHLVSHATNTFDVTRSGEKLVIDRHTDKTLPGPGNSATYTMEVKACNPECE